MTMLVMAFLFVGMTSCERDDEDIAWNLSGSWDGTITSYTNGRTYSATINFNQYGNSNHGDGYEYDGTWRYATGIGFDWAVENGCIYLDYDDNSHIIMDYDYMPSGYEGDVLKGYFIDYETGERLAYFYLEKINNYK